MTVPQMMTLRQASDWASEHLGRAVTPANIAYLVQYGRVEKNGDKGNVLVSRHDLETYYSTHSASREARWKQQLGDDLNWQLSFSQYKEAETTKHVHRLHPYKGKFIPQLVEYFLDTHTDAFKRQVFFQSGDLILDPFCGSGTALVQANELQINGIGIDVSEFNAFMTNAKLARYNTAAAAATGQQLTAQLKQFQRKQNYMAFDAQVADALNQFNQRFFPAPQFKYQVRQKQIDEQKYGRDKAEQFLAHYQQLVGDYQISLALASRHNADGTADFLEQWFLPSVRGEIAFLFNRIRKIADAPTRQLLSLILSRTVRSCRATTHADLATLRDPVVAPYYCKKHGKVCKPLFTIVNWWQRYLQDTIMRVEQFNKLRTQTHQHCLVGDSRTVDIARALHKANPPLARLLRHKKISGVFSSPPYVGLIDYHQQHAYAYDLFHFTRNDAMEIGPLCQGQGVAARQSYVRGVAEVLQNCKRFMQPDYNVFLVANDKYNLYPRIADAAQMQIVNRYKRPVLNRAEKDRAAYAEIIFHLKEK